MKALTNSTQSILLTGASSGIGKELAKLLFTQGHCHLSLLSNHAGDLEKLSTELNSITARQASFETYLCDITQPKEVEQTIHRVIHRSGKLDILINNAGIGLFQSIAETKLEDAKKVFDVNFWGAFHCIQAALPHLRSQKTDRKLIVNIGSIIGKHAAYDQSIYSASKAALERLTEAVEVEESHNGIHTLMVLPERTQTPFMQNVVGPKDKAQFPGGKLKELTAQDVARGIASAIQRKKKYHYTSLKGRAFALLSVGYPSLIDKVLSPKKHSGKRL